MPAASPAPRPPRRSGSRRKAAPPPRTKPLSEREFWEIYEQRVRSRMATDGKGQIRCRNGDCPIIATARAAGFDLPSSNHGIYWRVVHSPCPKWADFVAGAADCPDTPRSSLRARLLPPQRRGKAGAA